MGRTAVQHPPGAQSQGSTLCFLSFNVYMSVLSACMSATCIQCLQRPEEGSDPLELEQTVVSPCVGAGN